MASKRDQLQAHQFQVQRAVSALVLQETDPEQPPFRRVSGAAIGAVVLGVISLVIAGVFGLIFPGGNKSWQDGNSIIVEKETGTRFVYLDGQLHPMANYASAVLALGKKADALSISGNSLVGVPRGPVIGIPDAPDSLPGPDKALGGWSLCSQPTTGPTGASVASSVLLVGANPSGGTPVGGGAVLVRTSDTGPQYLLYNGYRHQIDSAETVRVGLAVSSVPVVRVSPALVESLPQGEPVGPIAVADLGKPSDAVPGRGDLKAGHLLTMQTPSGATQHYLVERHQLTPITELAYDIQLAYPPTATAYGGAPFGLSIPPSLVAGATIGTPKQLTEASPPTVRPAFVPATDLTSVCLGFTSGSFVPKITVSPGLPPRDLLIATAGRTAGGVALADYVYVPPGQVGIVEVMPSETAQAGTLAVVTDLGVAYPLDAPDVMSWLGYSTVKPVRVPAGLMARLPQGPGLSHEAALQRA
ncbi:type VII secretion protein EccB [Fodinicola acaciae]|uniref:type VII secretion protein EccB n=1 Tax=Fodinicola acaciae TaxID=2681555 RepID=UPI0013D15CE1|nr:type VII secretion protein EccB [Fodinicola acaciae]